MSVLRYFDAYPAATQAQVRELIETDRLAGYLHRRYAARHEIRTDKALYEYAIGLKQQYLRSAASLHKVVYQNKMDVLRSVLGLHTTISRVQGGRLKSKQEIRIASLFKDAPPEFLEMVVVHELAHLKESEHNKAFYQLCRHMLPDYHQIEFDLRLYLAHRELVDSAAAVTLKPL
ncbi:MAG: metal-dependent hydrolase [Hydrocarboniphaga sp.]|uniref:M48 metallopeptidase family protein n=1 Tax=Hydrocarboniphaga sp. TaxID=2033016 RepID=UPI002627EA8D|nr:M48 family metallopeptidase [Hydrocarboniphaga sp.]MDB5971262.1 metal-dependent hydrolase [Hydrocarboniphaga sp.]